ncbi:hypothetical protein G1O98_35825 [Nostoc sp. UIC10630]|nr:hypothetical protein [Nostoc sp. UIC 10630]
MTPILYGFEYCPCTLMSQSNCAAFCDINGNTRVLGVANIMPLFVTSIHSSGFECHGIPAGILYRFVTE